MCTSHFIHTLGAVSYLSRRGDLRTWISNISIKIRIKRAYWHKSRLNDFPRQNERNLTNCRGYTWASSAAGLPEQHSRAELHWACDLPLQARQCGLAWPVLHLPPAAVSHEWTLFPSQGLGAAWSWTPLLTDLTTDQASHQNWSPTFIVCQGITSWSYWD